MNDSTLKVVQAENYGSLDNSYGFIYFNDGIKVEYGLTVILNLAGGGLR